MGRILGEALLIVVSVYAAIILEGNSSDRQRKMEALDALVSLQAEMERDLRDVAEVIDVQNQKADDYERLNRWLRRPSAEIPDSFSVALLAILGDNRTLFPRSSAWKTMTSSGQLSALENQAIVGRLANLYENLNARLEYNGASYDERIQSAHYEVLGPVWDPVEEAFRIGNGSAPGSVGYMVQHLHGWNQFYGVLLVAWQREAQDLRAEVDQFLTASGRGT